MSDKLQFVAAGAKGQYGNPSDDLNFIGDNAPVAPISSSKAFPTMLSDGCTPYTNLFAGTDQKPVTPLH